METLEEVPDVEWSDAEDFWVESFRMMGSRLLNTQKGGQQRHRKKPARMTMETKRKIANSLRGRKVGGVPKGRKTGKPGKYHPADRARRAVLAERMLAEKPKSRRPRKRPE